MKLNKKEFLKVRILLIENADKDVIFGTNI